MLCALVIPIIINFLSNLNILRLNLNILRLLICYSDNYSSILLLPLERLLEFGMFDSLLIKYDFVKYLSATPTKRLQKMHWLDSHKNHIHLLTYTHFDTIIIGGSIAAGLSRYSNV